MLDRAGHALLHEQPGPGALTRCRMAGAHARAGNNLTTLPTGQAGVVGTRVPSRSTCWRHHVLQH